MGKISFVADCVTKPCYGAGGAIKVQDPKECTLWDEERVPYVIYLHMIQIAIELKNLFGNHTLGLI